MALSAPELLTAEHDVSAFSCGVPALDTWLKTRALSNQQKGFTVVMIVHEEGRVAGYYGLAPTSILPGSSPRSLRTGQPPNPVPCLLLGQLAADRVWAGKGLGNSLLIHALHRCLAAAELVGGRALIVNAVNAAAANFWIKHEFQPTKDDPMVLFRSIADVAASLRAAEGS